MTDRERLIELIKNYNPYFQNEKLADYLLENGVVILPCEVGNTLFTISRGEIIPVEVW